LIFLQQEGNQMAKEDVERFVGLLVSDDDFIEALKRNFDRAIVDRNLALDKKERLVLKESFETYVLPGTEIPTATGGTSPVAVPVAIAVAAAVAGAVAGSVATKVVDKVVKGSILTPMNQRIRDSILHRNLLTEAELQGTGVRDLRQLPVLRPFRREG
jgi:hypothetical protein